MTARAAPPAPLRARSRGGGLAALLLAVLLLTACGGDDGIRIVASSTPSPEPATETPTPEPTPVPVPERPPDPLGAGAAVAHYLVHGEADLDGCLPELVEAWGMAAVEGPRCLSADLDGDGREEFVFLATFPAEDEEDAEDAVRADVWFFDDEEAERRLYHSASAMIGGPIFDAEIVEASDVTRDERVDVVIAWERCHEEVCTTRLLIASHHNGSLENLVPLSVAVQELEELEIDPRERRLVLHGGVLEDEDAESGPRRGTMTVLTWSGSRFRAVERPGQPRYLVHLLNDADELYTRGDYREARELYEQAAANDELRDWKAELGLQAARPELQAYALLRAALSAQRVGDGSSMLALLDSAADEHPQTMHGAAALEYREALRGGVSPSAACERVETYLSTFADFHRQFWDYGSANPQRGIFTLCR